MPRTLPPGCTLQPGASVADCLTELREMISDLGDLIAAHRTKEALYRDTPTAFESRELRRARIALADQYGVMQAATGRYLARIHADIAYLEGDPRR